MRLSYEQLLDHDFPPVVHLYTERDTLVVDNGFLLAS